MSDYQDCPDLRYSIEWGTARAYERLAVHDPACAVHASYDSADHAALYWYITFYAKVVGGL